MLQAERLGLLIRILDPEDYRYIGGHDLRLESRLRRERMKIYRVGLLEIGSEIVDSYHARLANMNRAARWGAYGGLVVSTASMFLSLGKLWAAGALFGLRLPIFFDVAAQSERLSGFLTLEASGQLRHSHA
jgi:hypothetical protein